MAIDGEQPERSTDGELLPDEAAVLAERVEELEALPEDEHLTADEVAAELDIDIE